LIGIDARKLKDFGIGSYIRELIVYKAKPATKPKKKK